MVETLGEAHDLGWKLMVRCAYGNREGLKSIRPCTHNAYLDMPTLLWTRGRDMPLIMLGERLRCPACGSRRVSVMFDMPRNAGRAKSG